LKSWRKRTCVRIFAAVLFLHRRSEGSSARAWWAAVAASPHTAPGPVRQLALPRQKSVLGHRLEFDQATAWARAHPAWDDDDPPFVVHDSVIAPPSPARTEPLF
jgi:hypothetical protein